jgi:hypothetical protein
MLNRATGNGQIGRRGWIVLAALLALVASLNASRVRAHDHAQLGAAGRFYATWMMPDAPQVSCCSDEDCAPAASKFEGGAWWARWKDEDDWVRIPEGKVEVNRDTPDGRSHMCGRGARLGGNFTVFCFVRGGGA